MFRRRAKPGLSRKIVAYYLFFCLIAVSWLAAAAVFSSRAVVAERTANYCLTRIAGAGAAIKIQLQRKDLPRVIACCPSCAPSATRHGAHSWVMTGACWRTPSGEFVGQPAAEPAGARATWGDVTRVEFEHDDGRLVQEFRSPLMSSAERLGQLRVALVKPGLWADVPRGGADGADRARCAIGRRWRGRVHDSTTCRARGCRGIIPPANRSRAPRRRDFDLDPFGPATQCRWGGIESSTAFTTWSGKARKAPWTRRSSRPPTRGTTPASRKC